MAENKWGFLRETKAYASKAEEDNIVDKATGLEDYLKVIFPGVDDWIHDEPIGRLNGKSRRIRPDYRSEKLKLIIEFDGLQHYTDPLHIITDIKNTRDYIEGGYKVVRIPYFIQLTNNVVEKMFGVKVDEPLFPEGIPSMAPEGKNTPAFLCAEGIKRMAEELCKYPAQMDVNLDALESYYSDSERIDLSGYKILKFFLDGKAECQ